MTWNNLDGIERQPPEVQVAVLVNEVRNQKNSINGLRTDMQGLSGDLAALRRVLLSFAISVAGSAIVFSLTIWAVFK